LCNFLHSPVTSPLFGPNILLRTLFSNTLILWSSLKFSCYTDFILVTVNPPGILSFHIHAYVCCLLYKVYDWYALISRIASLRLVSK
jgi:hypothetical protein